MLSSVESFLPKQLSVMRAVGLFYDDIQIKGTRTLCVSLIVCNDMTHTLVKVVWDVVGGICVTRMCLRCSRLIIT